MKETALFIAAIAVASLMIALDLAPAASAQDASDSPPPRYVQEAALYDEQGHLVKILLGKETCRIRTVSNVAR